MEQKMNPWKKSHACVVDQRNELLPPCWAETGNVIKQRVEQGNDVHQSGSNRYIARRLVNLLNEAQTMAVVSSFLLADAEIEEAMLGASRRGVRIYVLLAIETRLGSDDREEEFDKRVLEQHKTMLERLGGLVLFRSAPHFHAKMLLIDPNGNADGILLTANLTKEALERNEELAVDLTPSEIREAASLMGWAMWESAEHEMLDSKRFSPVRPLGKIPYPSGLASIVATTSGATDISNAALSIINGANKRLVVSSFGWDKDHPVVQCLCERARNGLEVTVLARIRPASMSALIAMEQAGVKVFGFKWLHAKAIYSDRDLALVMSANLQSSGLDHGFEMGVILRDERANEVRRLLETWSNDAAFILHSAPKIGTLRGKVKIWHQSKLEDKEIKDAENVSLGNVTAESADQLDAPMPLLPSAGHLPRLAHELNCSWIVEAPKLSAKAKEIHQFRSKDKKPAISYSPPVYREPDGRTVVAVHTQAELMQAQEVAKVDRAVRIVVHERSLP